MWVYKSYVFFWHFFSNVGKNKPENCCWKFFSNFGKTAKIQKNFQKNNFGNFENKNAKFGKIKKFTGISKIGKKLYLVKIGIFFPNLEKKYLLLKKLVKKLEYFFQIWKKTSSCNFC